MHGRESTLLVGRADLALSGLRPPFPDGQRYWPRLPRAAASALRCLGSSHSMKWQYSARMAARCRLGCDMTPVAAVTSLAVHRSRKLIPEFRLHGPQSATGAVALKAAAGHP